MNRLCPTCRSDVTLPNSVKKPSTSNEIEVHAELNIVNNHGNRDEIINQGKKNLVSYLICLVVVSLWSHFKVVIHLLNDIKSTSVVFNVFAVPKVLFLSREPRLHESGSGSDPKEYGYRPCFGKPNSRNTL